MKAKLTVCTFAGALLFAASPGVFAQQTSSTQQKTAAPQGTASASQTRPTRVGTDRLEPDDKTATQRTLPADIEANRREGVDEDERAIIPYYNNFMRTYRLGPEDVISVQVFGQERYSKAGITVPPDGKISYPLIKGGVSVVGRTTEEVGAEIKRGLEEYIIDPDVTVSLEKAASARYAIIGDVGQPGVRVMTRRLTVREALAEAGGVLDTGNKKKIALLRANQNGIIQPIAYNLSDIEKGKAPDDLYVQPGDQIAVPGNTLKKVDTIGRIVSVAGFARMFLGGW